MNRRNFLSAFLVAPFAKSFFKPQMSGDHSVPCISGSFIGGSSYVPDGLAMLHRGEVIINYTTSDEWRAIDGLDPIEEHCEKYLMAPSDQRPLLYSSTLKEFSPFKNLDYSPEIILKPADNLLKAIHNEN